MSFSIDHVVILVHNLAVATEDYTELGFTVTPGGTHTDGTTENALVAFADGSYFELIVFMRAAPDHQWWRHVAHGEGLIDWALLPSDITADIAAASARGLAYSGPTPGGRLRPDGQELRWQTGRPATPDLPFLCADLTPRALRVPGGAARTHANGMLGIAQITVAVADLAASSARYQALLGSAPLDAESGDQVISFALGAARIRLIPASARLHGDGPFALVLRTSDLADETFEPQQTHGVVIDVVAAS